MGYFPLFVDLNQKEITVYGGGAIATRRIGTLLEFDAAITVVAPDCTSEIKEWAENHQLQFEQRVYKPGEIQQPFLVLAATSDGSVNEQICKECSDKGIWKNSASDRTKCDFYFPGIIKQDSTVIGVTESGQNHKKVKEITEKIRRFMREDF